MVQNELRERFNDLKRSGDSHFFGVPGERACRVLIGLRNGKPSLVFMTSSRPPNIDQFSAVSFECQGKQGSWKFFMIREDDAFEETFGIFCADVLSVIEGSDTEAVLFARLSARCEEWRKFWKRRNEALTEETVRGLAGELLFLERSLSEGKTPRETVCAWHGISGADQDFIFEDAWAEIKTIRQAATEVRISSLEQLVNPSLLKDRENVDGRLVVIRLHDDPVGGEIFTLSELHARICSRLKDDPWALQRFLGDTELAGMDVRNGRLETQLRLGLMEMKSYAVNSPGFPKLARLENVPEAVTKVSYSLSLPALENWLIKEE